VPPGHLDHIEQLIAGGVIGTPEPIAADFQIATTLRAMLAFEDYAPLLSGRPIEQLARWILPDGVPPVSWTPAMKTMLS
jgi:hypothetical protein